MLILQTILLNSYFPPNILFLKSIISASNCMLFGSDFMGANSSGESHLFDSRFSSIRAIFCRARSIRSMTRDCNMVLSAPSTRICASDSTLSNIVSFSWSSVNEILTSSSQYHVQESSSCALEGRHIWLIVK